MFHPLLAINFTVSSFFISTRNCSINSHAFLLIRAPPPLYKESPRSLSTSSTHSQNLSSPLPIFWPRDGGEPMPTAVALMDVKGAFDHVSRRRLLHLLDCMRFDDGTCRWVDSFMQGRTIRMDINGSAGMPRNSTLGLPQGSPVSPILFALYLSPLFK